MNRRELLDSVFDAVERHDLDFIEEWFAAHAHPEIEFTSVLTSGVEGRVYRGRRGMVDWAKDVVEAVKISYGAREFHQVGADIVVILVRPMLEGRGSGLEAQFEVGFVIEFEGDLARRGASYDSHAEAMTVAEALGRGEELRL